MTKLKEKLTEKEKAELIKSSTHCSLCHQGYRGISRFYSEDYGVICRTCWAKKLGDTLEQYGAAFID